jgi:hypothetical protein
MGGLLCAIGNASSHHTGHALNHLNPALAAAGVASSASDPNLMPPSVMTKGELKQAARRERQVSDQVWTWGWLAVTYGLCVCVYVGIGVLCLIDVVLRLCTHVSSVLFQSRSLSPSH